MSRLLILISLFVPAKAVAYQQPPAPAPKPAAEASAKPAEPVTQRQIEFETLSEEVPITLFEADPKLLERRFVAEVKLRAPTSYVASNSVRQGPSEGQQRVFTILQSLGDIKRLIEIIGQDQFPPDAPIHFLAREARFVLLLSESREQQVHTYTYRLLAPTPERAKELTQMLVAVFDQGVTGPIQEQIKKLKAEEEAKLAEYRQKLPAAQMELDALTQIKHPEVLEPQAINDLKTQRRLLEVDLAGVKARIDACDTILNRGGLSNTRRDQVENVKIAAEIELAGLVARQKTLDAIIDQAQKSQELMSKLTAVGARVRKLQQSIGQSESVIAVHTETMKHFGPVRPVDKVVIRPIKWEAREAKSPTK